MLTAVDLCQRVLLLSVTVVDDLTVKFNFFAMKSGEETIHITLFDPDLNQKKFDQVIKVQ
jgi:hypothetical protein